MILYINKDVVLEIQNDKAVGVGFMNGKPTKSEWLKVKDIVEDLLGYNIATWGAFTNFHTKVFWTEIGDLKVCLDGNPNILEILSK